MPYLLTAGMAFLIGSFPTAFLIVKQKKGLDLRREGSGNIGALNAFEVSRSKKIGRLVLFIDVLKGALMVLATKLIGDDDFTLSAMAFLFVVAGHNYSPWIGFRGGRGLATAAGASLILNPVFLCYWVLTWLAGFFKTKNVHFANIAATVFSPFILLATPGIARSMAVVPYDRDWQIIAVGFGLSILLLIRHLEPLRELIKHGIRREYDNNDSETD